MAIEQDRVTALFLNMWVARGVMAAIEMDVFEMCEGAGLTADEVGARIGLADRPARALLDTALATGLLERDADGRYRNAPDASRYLWSGSETSVRNYALDERWCWGAWGRLDEALRANAPTLPQDGDGYHTFPADFFLDFLHGQTLTMASALATAVDLSDARAMLDIGAGSGATSIALCRAYPALRSTMIDRPEVCAKAADHVARAGLSSRIDAQPTNIFSSDPLPSGADTVVIANMLHDFSPARAQEILRRVRGALPVGGRLVVMEMAPDEGRTGPPIAVAFALTMIVNTEGGDAYTSSEYHAWMRATGFEVERTVPLGGSIVTTAIEARAV